MSPLQRKVKHDQGKIVQNSKLTQHQSQNQNYIYLYFLLFTVQYFAMQFEELDREKLEDSLQWDQSQQNSQYKAAKLKDLFPVNYVEMREKFFQQKQEFNPHFIYKTVVYPQSFPVNRDHEETAMKILLNATPYPTNLPMLTQQEVLKITEQYLDGLGLADFVEIKFLFECLSRTSVAFFKDKVKLRIRTPLSYTKVNLEGVLNHQIGTHVIRTLNHRQNCQRKPSEKGKIIQEGLAAINQLLPEKEPFLFKPALRYLTAIYASQLDFKGVFKKVSKFISDKEECWREVVRVKRGISNTEEKGGFYKDQNYLIGAIQLLKNRKDIDFERLYYGKLAPSETLNLNDGVLPPFLGTPQKLKAYKKKLQTIAMVNFID